MVDLVLEVLNKSNIDVINCRRQSCDSAWNVGGTHNGMQAEMEKHCKHADSCPFAAHALNLVGELASSCCTEHSFFFVCFDYQWIYNFFS